MLLGNAQDAADYVSQSHHAQNAAANEVLGAENTAGEAIDFPLSYCKGSRACQDRLSRVNNENWFFHIHLQRRTDSVSG